MTHELFKATVFNWWQEHDNNRGEWAELRRCSSIEDIFLLPAYYRLKAAINKQAIAINAENLAVITGVLATVKADNSLSMAQLMGQGADDDKPVKKKRFERLIKTLTVNTDLYLKLIRALRLINNTVNIRQLANDLRYWNIHTRRQWAEEYFLNKAEIEKLPKGEKL